MKNEHANIRIISKDKQHPLFFNFNILDSFSFITGTTGTLEAFILFCGFKVVKQTNEERLFWTNGTFEERPIFT